MTTVYFVSVLLSVFLRCIFVLCAASPKSCSFIVSIGASTESVIRYAHLAYSYLLNKDPAPTCEHRKCVLTIEYICRVTAPNMNVGLIGNNTSLTLNFHTCYCILQNVCNYLTDVNLLSKM